MRTLPRGQVARSGVIEEEVVRTRLRCDVSALALCPGDLRQSFRDRDVDDVKVAACDLRPIAGTPDRLELRCRRPRLVPARAIGPPQSAELRSQKCRDVLVLGMHSDDAAQLSCDRKAGVEDIVVDPLEVNATRAHERFTADDALGDQTAQIAQVIVDEASPMGVVDDRFRPNDLPLVGERRRVGGRGGGVERHLEHRRLHRRRLRPLLPV